MLTGRPSMGGFLWQEYNVLIYEAPHSLHHDDWDRRLRARPADESGRAAVQDRVAAALRWHNKQTNEVMIKSLNLLTEFIRDARPILRQLDNRPKKASKHRYERRKVREFLRLGDWAEEAAL